MTTVHTLDLDYLGMPESIAVYVVMGPDGPVMIETGPGCTTDALTRGLAGLGLTPGDVRDVLVTHIHFDHAGASGWMARHGARIHVHSFGAKHLVDPSKLVASATRIYGDSMSWRWGELIPIPPAQVNAVEDGDVLHVGGLEILAVETPGHARHHHAYVLEADGRRIAFTGDAAACHVEACPDFVSLPTPPPEFDLDRWTASVERLQAERLDVIYPTHFGAVADPTAHLERVVPALIAHSDFVGKLLDAGLDRDAMLRQYTDWYLGQAEAAGLPPRYHRFYVTDTLASMNLDGLVRYWTKQGRRAVVPARSVTQ